jgi:branched-subunit amino acid aminotransferase/4-amino-4-deoxychorismate lyase
VASPRPARPVEVDGVPVDPAELGLINYGHFTAMVVDEDLQVLGLQLHLDRLVRDCALVFGAPLDIDRVRAWLHQVAVRCERPTLLRATVFAPTGTVARPGLPVDDPQARPSVLINAREFGPTGSPAGMRVQTRDFVRNLFLVKHLGAFGQMHERRLAQQAGFDDALFCTGPEPSALVCEGTTWNIGVLIGDELVWPDDQCLPGVTRELLRAQAGILWSSRPVTRTDLASARAAFATSVTVGVEPIIEIDGRALPGDPGLLAELQAGYAAIPTTQLQP